MAFLRQACRAVAARMNLRSKAKLNTQSLLTATSLCLFITTSRKAEGSIHASTVRQVEKGRYG